MINSVEAVSVSKDFPYIRADIRGFLENGSAEDILKWALSMYDDRIAIASSFGAEDAVLIDMASRIKPDIRVFTLDTGRLPYET